MLTYTLYHIENHFQYITIHFLKTPQHPHLTSI